MSQTPRDLIDVKFKLPETPTIPAQPDVASGHGETLSRLSSLDFKTWILILFSLVVLGFLLGKKRVSETTTIVLLAIHGMITLGFIIMTAIGLVLALGMNMTHLYAVSPAQYIFQKLFPPILMVLSFLVSLSFVTIDKNNIASYRVSLGIILLTILWTIYHKIYY
jgi:hypothetical protein